MTLPGGKTEFPAALRLSVSEPGGGGLPDKKDYFLATRLQESKGRGGKKGRRVIHETAHARLLQAIGKLAKLPEPPKTTDWVPCLVPFDDPDDVISSAMACYYGSRRVCSCGVFDLKDEETARGQKLGWPPVKDQGGEVDSRYYTGTATRHSLTTDGKGNRRIAGTEPVTCDPSECPIANEGRDAGPLLAIMLGDKAAADKYATNQLCKPDIRVPLILPWASSMFGVFITTAWHSYRRMHTTLRTIRDLSGGVLANIPLKLRVEWIRTGEFYNPITHFETIADPARLPQLGDAELARREKNATLALSMEKSRAEAKALIAHGITNALEVSAFQQEFNPELTNGDPEPESVTEQTEFSDKVIAAAEILDWSEGTMRLKLKECGGDMEALEAAMYRELHEGMMDEEDGNDATG